MQEKYLTSNFCSPDSCSTHMQVEIVGLKYEKERENLAVVSYSLHFSVEFCPQYRLLLNNI